MSPTTTQIAPNTSIPCHPYAAFLDKVEKPARYAGGEPGSAIKDWNSVEATVCLAFPDIYDIGMSHLGFKILYKLLNDDRRTLAERCYTPWTDMERELAARDLPLVSLESARPLRDFDVIGFSLQFEMTYSNILTMLHLGRVPLRSQDRNEDDPLVIAGGPTATHPEPLAAFIDAFCLGDGEEKASQIALTWARLKREGKNRRERLIALAQLGAVYVPSLYETAIDPDTNLMVVTGPLKGLDLPFPIERALVDLKQYPFPDTSPTGGPEAIFDRMSIEIARGCTEGCRFCQAGMIYRPVRERDPEQIVDTVMRAVKNSGQDEVSLTALSTADVSCISPLIKTVARKLAAERISLGVSSLRAYGLEPELLDEMKRVRATGLTFAPEAGTQRMRDVVNKNVTEEQLLETAERVFSRGWPKMKLYFMIGLPTETDEDVLGIVETGIRTAQTGRKAAKKRIDVTVSVSTHVPKPHTPFQWAAMDTLSEVARKQSSMRQAVRGHKMVTLKTHDAQTSVLEAIFARGDRPLADVLERAWRHGARFDSWEDKLRLDVWEEAFSFYEIDRNKYLGTLPVTAKLPWSHIDVGLEDGFLAKEYKKALRNRLSPPCGKAVGMFVHHNNMRDALADTKKLVCYDCGVACDMTQMRNERIDFLKQLGALEADSLDVKKRLPVYAEAPVELGLEQTPEPSAAPAQKPSKKRVTPPPPTGIRHRLQYEKTGPSALLGHLDVVRELPRVMRRAGIAMSYTQGFHPKPDMSFGPALSLGVMSLSEFADMRLERALSDEEIPHVLAELNQKSPAGLHFQHIVPLEGEDPGITKVVNGARYLLIFARSALELPAGVSAEAWLSARCEAAMAQPSLMIRREIEGIGKMLDVRSFLRGARLANAQEQSLLERAGLWGNLVAITVDALILGSGAVKSSEIATVIAGDGQNVPPHQALRIELYGEWAGQHYSPLDLTTARKMLRAQKAEKQAEKQAALQEMPAE